MKAIVHNTSDPQRCALRIMGRVAREASDLPNIKEWVSLLIANRAERRNDMAALKAIYDAVLGRWAYVRESDEWVPGDPERLLGYVLGVKYNTQRSPLTAPISSIPAKIKGWGDCDDVSTIIAALVRAAGMIPLFRVARWAGGAHVSVTAILPDGRQVSMDPVAHPEHPFGWRLKAPSVTFYDLDGSPVSISDADPNNGHKMNTQYNLSGFGCCGSAEQPCHVVILRPDAPDGPRSLATDERSAKMMSKGVVMDGTPAWDQYGCQYGYCANRDIWVPMGGPADRMRRRQRRRRRRVKRRRAIARGIRNVGQAVGRGAKRALRSPVVRGIVAGAGQAIGIPAPATAAALRLTSAAVDRAGRGGVARAFRRSPVRTAAAVARSAPALQMMASQGMGATLAGYEMIQGGRMYRAAPVVAMSGIPGAVYMGDLDISPAPAPGVWYRIHPGDNLLKVAGKAFGLGSGSARLKAAKLINNHPANTPYFESDNTDNLFKSGKLSFSPKWSSAPQLAVKGERGDAYAVIWIPATEGDNPPEVPDVTEVPDIPETPETPKVEDTVPDVPEVEPDLPVEPEVPEIKPDETPDEQQTLPDIPETPQTPDDGVTIPPIEPDVPELPESSDDVNEGMGLGTFGVLALVGVGGFIGYKLLKGKRRR